MRQLLPTRLDDAAPDFDALRPRARPAREPGAAPRPWVMANMVMSLDGSYTVDGRSAGLSSAADRLLFHRLRAVSDVVLVGAGTAREENYRRPSNDDEATAWRRAHGLTDAARLALVSARAQLPDTLPLLGGEGYVPVLIHPATAHPTFEVEQIETRACGETSVDLDAMLTTLAADGAEVVLCEGGPMLLGSLNRADLIDELFVTLSPLLVGGAPTGLLDGIDAEIRRYEPRRILEADGSLFLNYRRVHDTDLTG